MVDRDEVDDVTAPPGDDIDEDAWADVAARRLEELRSGAVRGIPAEEVFARIRERRRPNTTDARSG